MDELGYVFHHLIRGEAIDRWQLDVNVYARPTGEHFDPVQAAFRVVTGRERVESLVVRDPWRGHANYRVCPSRVILQDHKGKVVEAATCGGELEIGAADRHTHCCLRSPAPIIQLVDGPASTETILVNEVEALLARRRAALGFDDAGYEQRLARVDPLLLFMVSLATLEARLSRVPAFLRQEQYRNACHVVRRTIRLLMAKGVWAAGLPSLGELI